MTRELLGFFRRLFEIALFARTPNRIRFGEYQERRTFRTDLAVRTRPQCEFAVGVARTREERSSSFARFLFDDVALFAGRTLHACLFLNRFDRFALRVLRAGEELSKPAVFDHHRRTTRGAFLIDRRGFRSSRRF